MQTEKDWFKALRSLAAQKFIALDFVLKTDAYGDGELLSVGVFDGEKAVLGGIKLGEKTLIKGLTEMKTGANIRVGCGLKSLYVVVASNEVELTDKIFDVKVASYLLNPLKKRYHLEDIWADISKSTETVNIEEIDPDSITEKLTSEAISCLCRRLVKIYHCYPALLKRLTENNLLELYTGIEQTLTGILARMEYRGIKVLPEKLRELSKVVNEELADISEEIYQWAGEEFNLNSSQQLGEILFNKLDLPVMRKIKTGYSTDADTLEMLSEHHPLPGKIMSYRKLAKLKSTYIDTLPQMINPRDGRVHTRFHQEGTATGRLSSSDPNLQNIPARSALGKEIREAFVSEAGYSLISADYSHMELRVLAHFSNDDALKEAFLAGEDIHSRTAAEIFNCFPALVTREMRRQAKAVNFGVIYGLSAFSLARQLKISRTEANSIINRYFERYQNLKEYIKGVITEAKVTGEVRTITGRRRILPEIMSPNKNRREFSERAAVNTVIQGSSADIIKIAMINIAGKIKENNLKSRLLLQIHDELVFEAPDNEARKLQAVITREMEQAYPLNIPLKVEIAVGKNWAVLH